MTKALDIAVIFAALAGAMAAAPGALAAGSPPAAAMQGAMTAAMAGQPERDDPFSSLVGKRERQRRGPEAARVERYITTTGEKAFLLETDGEAARIKFLCNEDDPRLDCRIDPEGPAEEIFLLTTSRGSRGDLLFRDQLGDTVLRIAAHGGATVHWPGEQQERGASRDYADALGALELVNARRGDAHRRSQGAAAHLSALAGSPIVFDVGPRPPRAGALMAASPAIADRAGPAAEANTLGDAAATLAAERGEDRVRGDATVLADAVARVAGGMHLVADDPTGARITGARISVVRFVEAYEPRLSLDGGTLTVFYNPAGGLAGRPSSTMVAKYLEDSL